jgi:hypothetical protein
VYWTDDARPLARAPREYWSPLIWDAVDHTAFRPLTRALLLETGREAVNVNALDEVPDSTWFTNRLSRRALTPEEVAEGACAGHPAPDPNGIWTVTQGKPNGWAPGFVARGPDGQRYLIKAEGVAQSEQPTAADTIGSRIFWAAGYFTPCNRILRVRPEQLVVAPDATFEDETGHDRAMTRAQLDPVFERATCYPDGSYRFGMSLFVEGRPLGPFRYEGTRDDDPNDVIPHEDRRDLRAARLVSAWLGHFDAREQNTLTTFVRAPGGGYVRHWMIDFADCMDGIWPIDGLSRRMGQSYYFDLEHITQDWLALGLIPRPWNRARVDPEGWIFGYFSAQDFAPEHWRAGYPNPVYDRMTERDGAWMARIIARFSDAHLRAIVAQAHFRHAPWAAYLEHTLAARRDRILARYLTRPSPTSPSRATSSARSTAPSRATSTPAPATPLCSACRPRGLRAPRSPPRPARAGGCACASRARWHRRPRPPPTTKCATAWSRSPPPPRDSAPSPRCARTSTTSAPNAGGSWRVSSAERGDRPRTDTLRRTGGASAAWRPQASWRNGRRAVPPPRGAHHRLPAPRPRARRAPAATPSAATSSRCARTARAAATGWSEEGAACSRAAFPALTAATKPRAASTATTVATAITPSAPVRTARVAAAGSPRQRNSRNVPVTSP